MAKAGRKIKNDNCSAEVARRRACNRASYHKKVKMNKADGVVKKLARKRRSTRLAGVAPLSCQLLHNAICFVHLHFLVVTGYVTSSPTSHFGAAVIVFNLLRPAFAILADSLLPNSWNNTKTAQWHIHLDQADPSSIAVRRINHNIKQRTHPFTTNITVTTNPTR